MKLANALAGLVLLASVARAQATAEELARCAAMRVSSRRLECYDALAKPKSTPGETVAAFAPGTGRIGKWIVSRETDPISDQKGVTFVLEAEGGGLFDTRNLIIRCKRGELDVYLSPHEYLGEDNDQITIRLGTDAPIEQRWSGSSDHTALFHPGDRAAIEAFVRSLARYDRAAFQVSPYDKAPLSMVFRLDGIGQVTQELWAICPPSADGEARNDSTPPIDLNAATGLEPAGSQVFFESVVQEKPEILQGPELRYPDLLRQAAIQGRVIVQVIVDTLGHAEPGSVKIIQSANPGFDQPAKNYVLRALFRPGRNHGRPVRVLLNLPIDFKIKR